MSTVLMKILKVLMILFITIFVSITSIFFLRTPSLLSDLSFSTAIFDEKDHLLRLTLNKDEQYRLFTPLSTIPKELVQATLLQEDRYFKQHVGVNPLALAHAMYQTYILKNRRFGASTITMQVARLRFKLYSKSVWGKFQQILRALQLEMHYSKDQILEAYFNLAPYGGNIEGVGAASLIYFNKSAQQLNLLDALTLSVIPQNPSKRGFDNTYLKIVRDKLFQRWIQEHPEDKDKSALMRLPLSVGHTKALPFEAPHFVNSILATPNPKLSSKTPAIHTNLDWHLQKIVEGTSKNYIQRQSNKGVYNAAVLLVDTRDMGIRSMLGSVNFFDKKISGQINGTEIPRSPGSTLKPFVFGRAIDIGLIHPNTVLKDVPHSFGNYNPENFDKDFMGPIRARDALVLSRNIPAIFLESQLGAQNLYQLLSAINIKGLKSESYYGLNLSIGGAELTMQELVSLYAMLQNDGVWKPLQTGAFQNTEAPVRLLSPEASFLVVDMLKNTARPIEYQALSTKQLPISWKTGTSSGFRDAWTVGLIGPYALAVWIGNFDNKGNPAFVGKNIAAPLFFALSDAIQQEKGRIPFLEKNPLGMNLVQVEICKASGMLPTRYCPTRETTWFIPGKSPIKTDTIYREIAINSKTGLRTCHFNEDTRFEIYEFWPTDLLKIFKSAGIQRRNPPLFESDCILKGNAGLKPQITSPQKEVTYVIAEGTQKSRIPLSAVVDGDVRVLYWFANNAYLGKSSAGNTFFWDGKPGKFIIRVLDDHGLSDARDIRVLGLGH